jgi:uncharacterized surface protein with fasciclin (FAS1) repeats
MSQQNIGVRLATVLWGNWYVERFLNVALPSLLSEGNLPTVTKSRRGHYDLTTRATDAAVIERSPVYAKLKSLVKVRLKILPDIAFTQNVHETHRTIWHASVKAASRHEEWLVFVQPDGCWAEGALRTIADRFAAGKTAICAFFLRVDDEAFMAALRKHGYTGISTITIPARALIDIAIRTCAPLSCAYFRNSSHVPTHTEYVLFPIAREGFILRSVATHLWAIFPSRFRTTANLGAGTPEDLEGIEYLTDSDEFAHVSLTPLSQQLGWYSQRQACAIGSEAALGVCFFSDLVNHLWRQTFRMHRSETTPSRWLSVERQADVHMALVYLNVRARWVHRQLKLAGLQSAAKLLAGALHVVRWKRNWPRMQPLCVLAPSNSAFDGPLDPYMLLATGREAELDRLLRSHVLVGSDDLFTGASGAVRSATGQAVDLHSKGGTVTVGGRRVLREIARNNDPGSSIRIYEIDGLLQ